MTVTFMCGCILEVDGSNELIIDDDGFIICPFHGMRRYGWRSLVSIVHTVNEYPVARPAYGLSLQENEAIFWSRMGYKISQSSTPSGGAYSVERSG